MPTEGFDGIGKLFIKGGDGEYVPLMDVKECSAISEEKLFNAEALKETVQEMEDRLREEQPPDTVMMNDEIMMILMMNGYIREEAKEFRYCGLRVVTSPYLPMNQIFLTTWEYAEEIIRQITKTEISEVAEKKQEQKMYHCRVCGTRYQSKQEAKECVRTHDWQNRRGRR